MNVILIEDAFDAKGNVTSYTYNALGQEMSETLPDSTTSVPQTENFTYDQFGRPAIDYDFDGNATAYVYDNTATGDGRVTGEYFFLAGNPPQDSSGNLRTTHVDSSTTYTYTPLGQQYIVTDDSGPTTYTYDSAGNITEEATPEGTINYVYNGLNQQTDMWTGNVTYTNRSTSAETWVQYTYDNLGRLSTVTQSRLNGSNVDLITTYGYDGDGNKAYESDPNGDITTYTYSALNQLTAETVKNGSATLYSVTYTLNPNGTRATATEKELQSNNSNTTINTTWTYNSLDWLTSETVASSVSIQSFGDIYSYDLDGNRTQEVIDYPLSTTVADTIHYTYNGNDELTAQTETAGTGTTVVYSTSFGYDNNGSQTSVTSTGTGGPANATYGYDVRNKMISFSSGSTSATYLYDDAGDRVQETTGGTTTYYLTDDNNPTSYAQPIETWTSTSGSLTGATHAMTYLIGDHIYGQDSGSGTVSYYLVDGHNSVRAVVSSSGTLVTSLGGNSIGISGWMNYDGFGDAVNGWSQSVAALGGVIDQYAGDAVFDPASGLYMNGDGTRPRTGYRFIQMDPITITAGDLANDDLYLYADANSVNGWDPTGHDFDLLTTLIAVGITSSLVGVTTGIEGGITGMLTGDGFARGFGEGAVSGFVSTAVPLLLEAAFDGNIPPSIAFGLGGGLGELASQALFGNIDSVEGLTKIAISAATGGVLGQLFGAAAVEDFGVLVNRLEPEVSAILTRFSVNSSLNGLTGALKSSANDLFRDLLLGGGRQTGRWISEAAAAFLPDAANTTRGAVLPAAIGVGSNLIVDLIFGTIGFVKHFTNTSN